MELVGSDIEPRKMRRGPVAMTARGPMLPIVGRSARRGGRCPAGAHAVAVGAAHRLHCAARSGVASPNSLHSLRSFRSNNRDESDHEARAARAPTPALRCSSPPKSPPPGSARREAHGSLSPLQTPLPFQQRRVRAGCGAPLERREAQGSWPRAQRASTSDSSRLSERSERSERSEFGDGAMRLSIAGQSARSDDRSSEASRPARTRLCRSDHYMRHERPTATSGRKQTTATQRSH